jgi:hypothetical protein
LTGFTLVLSLTRNAVGQARSASFIITNKIPLIAGAADDGSSTLRTVRYQIRTQFACPILGEIGILTFSAFAPRTIALYTMQSPIGALRTFTIIVEEVIPLDAASTSAVAGTCQAALQRSITSNALALLIRIV